MSKSLIAFTEVPCFSILISR